MSKAVGINQTTLFEELPNSKVKKDTSSTFKDNLSIPIHRWFRYPAGFSASWVQQLLNGEHRGKRVLDPFAGSGTVLLAGEASNVESMGIESHPFVSRIAQAKLHWREDPNTFYQHAATILERAKRRPCETLDVAPILKRVFPPETLSRLLSLRQAWREVDDGGPCSQLVWLTLASILRSCSPVGTAQWQYLLPNKSKGRVADPFEAFLLKARIMMADMVGQQSHSFGPAPILYAEDARERTSVPDNWAELVITSPPYANNYDYADATRLEMSFFGEIEGWSDLQLAVRKYLVRSCTQHVARLSKQTFEIIDEPLLGPIRDGLFRTCKQLDLERKEHGGNKPYHTMIATYFSDLAKVWQELRRVTTPGASICFVIGDSAPYGIHVPVEKWLGELARGVGFESYSFVKTRDRNVKWENRKHRVPLHEGQLWVQG